MNNDKSYKSSVLVIAAHPDDEVLGCGGTIAKLVSLGSEVNVAFLSDGVTSRKKKCLEHTFELATRQSAATKAMAILGHSKVSFGILPDNQLDTVPLLDIAKIVESFVEEYRPQTILTHYGFDVNIDHQKVNEAVQIACRPQIKHSVKSILCFETPSSTEWVMGGSKAPGFNPNWFVDISQTLSQKLLALDQYATELRAWPHPRSRQAVEHLAHWRGATIGVDAAEAFILGRKIE